MTVCARKNAYPDRAAALRAIAWLRRHGITYPLYPYHCACGMWHLSASPRPTVPHAGDAAEIERLLAEARAQYRAGGRDVA